MVYNQKARDHCLKHAIKTTSAANSTIASVPPADRQQDKENLSLAKVSAVSKSDLKPAECSSSAGQSQSHVGLVPAPTVVTQQQPPPSQPAKLIKQVGRFNLSTKRK